MVTPPSEAALRVVIVTYSAGHHLGELFDSLPAARTGGDLAVTVVDNGSTDGTVEWVRERPLITLEQPDHNLGYGGAANVGARSGTEPWVLVANSDLTFAPGAIDRLLEAAGRHPRAGVLGPRILTTDGQTYPSARELPSLGRGVGHAVFGLIWPGNPWTASYLRDGGTPAEGTVGWLSGACLLLRREAFEEVGGFDESYFMYFEDIDLCERIATAGWEVVHAPEAIITHAGGHSTSQDSVAMSRAHHVSAYLYLSRHYAGLRYLPLRVVLRAGLWVRYQFLRGLNAVVRGERLGVAARRP